MYRQYRQFEKDEFIAVALDTCAGGGDFGAGQFLSTKKLDIPLVYHSQQTTESYLPLLCRTLEQIYDQTSIPPCIAIERANGGSFLIDRLASMNFNNKFDIFIMPTYGTTSEDKESKRLGWDTNSATRPVMLQDIQSAINNQTITIYDKPTVEEMFSFVEVMSGGSWRAQAEKGKHDDLVISLAIVWQIFKIAKPRTAIENKNYDKYERYAQENVNGNGIKL